MGNNPKPRINRGKSEAFILFINADILNEINERRFSVLVGADISWLR